MSTICTQKTFWLPLTNVWKMQDNNPQFLFKTINCLVNPAPECFISFFKCWLWNFFILFPAKKKEKKVFDKIMCLQFLLHMLMIILFSLNCSVIFSQFCFQSLPVLFLTYIPPKAPLKLQKKNKYTQWYGNK